MNKFSKIIFGFGVFIIVLMVIGLMNEETPTKDEVKKEKVEKVKKKEIEVSFNKLYQDGNSIVCYTDDPDSLWTNKEWSRKIKRKMSKLKSGDLTVLLFNSKKNTPNLNYYSFFDYPQSLDKHMVCGYWRFNYEKFCYGGVDEDGNFIKCEEK
tara:strand:+ start:93 stop:551 length:459 start_codon:yes stop_codon:yes gene_type:complete